MKSINALEAIEQAKELLAANPLFLDTETTGLDEDAEIVEISILDISGNIVFHSLVKPVFEIPEGATAIHGITNKDVENSPKFSDIITDLTAVIKDRKTLIYNEDYDIRLMLQSARISGAKEEAYQALSNALLEPSATDCIMLLYAKYKGIISERGGYKWHKLIAAAEEFGINNTEAHRASADCLMTLEVLKALSNQ